MNILPLDETPIIAAFIWTLAAWTVTVHIAVATGASFSRLVEFSPITLLVAIIGWFMCGRKSDDPPPFEKESRRASIPWLIAAALVLATYSLGYFPFWLTAFLFTLAGWLWTTFAEKGTSKIISPTDDSLGCPLFSCKANFIGLAVLCAFGVFITLLLHQPDIDDSFYISVAADAHRHPDRAIWSTDTVHDDSRLPVFLPVYKAEAYEHLIALTAKLFHISSVRAAHTVLPVTFSIFIVLAWAMLARTIDPKNWLAITTVTIAISLLAGASRPGPANFTFTRLQQGKAVMVAGIVPILCVYAWRFTTTGGWRNVVMLAATQIAGVGLSSTAILIGPAVAGCVGLFCVPYFHSRDAYVALDRRSSTEATQASQLQTGLALTSILRLFLIAATCIYPMSMEVLMRGKMLAVTWLTQSPVLPVADMVTHVLGDRKQLIFFLAGLIAAWTVAPRRSRKLLLAPVILLLGVMINPALAVFLQTHVFSPLIYWRGTWVVPWLIWSATLVCGLSCLAASFVHHKNLWISRAISIAIGTIILIFMLAAHPIWRHQNGTHFHFAGLTVDEDEYAVAQRLALTTPPGTSALAPELVACWTAVLDERPPLIFVRSFYTQSTPATGGIEDVKMRNQLGEIAGKSNLNDNEVTTLVAGIIRYHLGAIALKKNAGDSAAIALQKAGFSRRNIGDYTLWVRAMAP